MQPKNRPPLPSYQTPEQEKEKLLINWQEAIKKSNESLKNTHIQKEYSFSTTELRQMIKIYTTTQHKTTWLYQLVL